MRGCKNKIVWYFSGAHKPFGLKYPHFCSLNTKSKTTNNYDCLWQSDFLGITNCDKGSVTAFSHFAK